MTPEAPLEFCDVVGQSLFHGVLATSHAYISFGDHGGDWPSFETGEEPVVANGSLVYVSCAGDDVAVDVRASEPDDVDGWQLVYDGPLTVEGVQIGTFMSTNLEPVDVPLANATSTSTSTDHPKRLRSSSSVRLRR
jgi:hypothetical protein